MLPSTTPGDRNQSVIDIRKEWLMIKNAYHCEDQGDRFEGDWVEILAEDGPMRTAVFEPCEI